MRLYDVDTFDAGSEGLEHLPLPEIKLCQVSKAGPHENGVNALNVRVGLGFLEDGLGFAVLIFSESKHKIQYE